MFFDPMLQVAELKVAMAIYKSRRKDTCEFLDIITSISYRYKVDDLSIIIGKQYFIIQVTETIKDPGAFEFMEGHFVKFNKSSAKTEKLFLLPLAAFKGSKKYVRQT
jgi:hypothetical protein